MRQQFICDGIEHFDFHISWELVSQKLSKLILDGSYVPERAQRILVEKGKGLCRQLVIPSIRDAIVLQCISDALYIQIRDKAPTNRAFFEPKEHGFSNLRSEYGTFASWINFQKELFKFSNNRPYIVITDIANYYDSISYSHLRNAIAGITDVEECILDMLIYVLSDLLWQPDYTPRVEVGLPQINMDAPRLLAHCFLYQLDEFLNNGSDRDFVRYMDDIDIGVESLIDAKEVLKSVDLVLQTKQIRLNSGKTQIITQQDALKHFRVFQNARLDALNSLIDKQIKKGLSLERSRKLIAKRIRRGFKKGEFDDGNGEKILKRWITLASKTGTPISPKLLEKVIRLRPSVREKVLSYLRGRNLTPAQAKMLSSVACSGWLIDDASIVDISNHLVETCVRKRHGIEYHLNNIMNSFNPEDYYGFYCKIWLLSKYSTDVELIEFIEGFKNRWLPHDRLGRLVGSFRPLFRGSNEEEKYNNVIYSSMNLGAREAYKFQHSLENNMSTFMSMLPALKNPNPSRGTRITHPKFLCLMSALKNKHASSSQINLLSNNNSEVFNDIFYRTIAQRIRIRLS